MSFELVLSRAFRTRLIAITLLIIASAALLSALIFYFHIDSELGETYSQKYGALSAYRTEIIKESVLIFAGFTSASLFVTIIFSVIYTHKIVGPLYRVRIIAKLLSEKNFDVAVRFREKDAIQPLAESLARFAETSNRRYSGIRDLSDKLYSDTVDLKKHLKDRDYARIAAQKERLLINTEELRKMLASIKV